jgi:peptide/nickel transport system permease protein
MADRATGRLGEAFLAARGSRTALLVLALVVVATIGAPLLAPHDPLAILDPVGLRSQMPSWHFPMGTDPYGRDLLSRTMVGGRLSLLLALSSVGLGMLFGVLVGVVSGFGGGVADRVLMRLVDVASAIPRVLLLLTLLSFAGRPGTGALVLVLAGTGWMATSRLVRGELRAMAREERIIAARAMGVSRWGIIRRHLLPWLAPLLAVVATGGIAQVLLLETGLSFLGLGVQPPTPSWGAVLRDVGDVAGASRWLALGPGLWIALTVSALHRLGDTLQSAIDRVHHVAAS